jgi:hypothetical protein|nr:MAG TPA: hypothetical protein [Caudoviricetes sp.]
MIDCSKAENYFAEKERMTKRHHLHPSGAYVCGIDCDICQLSSSNNGTSAKLSCFELESCYPKKAIAIVQKWSDEHQQKTYLSEFLKNYPNAPLVPDGTPEICPLKLGLTDIKTCREGGCAACWNQPIEESEK